MIPGNMMPRVVKAGPAEFGPWAEMRARMWDGEPAELHLTEIEAMVGEGRLAGYLALLPSGKPAGFAEASLRDYANGCLGRPVPFLEGIWVEPGFRRRGVGRALIEALTGELRAEGFRELASDVDVANHPSLRAHAGWGFAEVERVVCFRLEIV